jgi:hypothetical protein
VLLSKTHIGNVIAGIIGECHVSSSSGAFQK